MGRVFSVYISPKSQRETEREGVRHWTKKRRRKKLAQVCNWIENSPNIITESITAHLQRPKRKKTPVRRSGSGSEILCPQWRIQISSCRNRVGRNSGRRPVRSRGILMSSSLLMLSSVLGSPKEVRFSLFVFSVF